MRRVLFLALRGGSMQLILTGVGNKYGFPMSEKECTEGLAELNVTVEQARQWAQTLQQYLLERESERKR